MKNLLSLFAILLIAASATAQDFSTGRVLDAETGEPILFGSVAGLRDDQIARGTQTDFGGNFKIDVTDLDSIEVSYVGYETSRLSVSDLRKDNVVFMQSGVMPSGVTMICCYIPLINPDICEQGPAFTAEDIAKLPGLIEVNSDDDNSPATERSGDDELEEETIELQIFPNPTSGKLNVRLGAEETEGWLTVINVTGRTVQRDAFRAPLTVIDLADLPPGSYFVRLTTTGGVKFIRKVVKI